MGVQNAILMGEPRGHASSTPTGHRWRVLLLWLWAALLLSACGPAESGQPIPPLGAVNPRTALTPVPGVAGDPNEGRRLFVVSGCGGCHTLYGLEGAHGVAGPNVTNITLRPTLAGDTIPMTPDTLTFFLLDPQAVKPTSTMPRVGLTEQQARDLTAFLYSQPFNPER